MCVLNNANVSAYVRKKIKYIDIFYQKIEIEFPFLRPLRSSMGGSSADIVDLPIPSLRTPCLDSPR